MTIVLCVSLAVAWLVGWWAVSNLFDLVERRRRRKREMNRPHRYVSFAGGKPVIVATEVYTYDVRLREEVNPAVGDRHGVGDMRAFTEMHDD